MGSGPRKSKINWRYLQYRFRLSSLGDCSVISERLNNTRAIFRRPPSRTLPLRFSWRETESPIINYPLAGYVTVGIIRGFFFFRLSVPSALISAVYRQDLPYRSLVVSWRDNGSSPAISIGMQRRRRIIAATKKDIVYNLRRKVAPVTLFTYLYLISRVQI